MRKVNTKKCSLFSYIQVPWIYEIYIQVQKKMKIFLSKKIVFAHNRALECVKNARKYAEG